MRVTRLLRANHSGGYQPRIHFLGKRPQGQHSSAPAPHPAAPKDVIESSFLSKLSSSSEMRSPADASSGYGSPRQVPASHGGNGGSGNGTKTDAADKISGPISSKPADFENFWEAPKYLWYPKEVSETELEAVMSGGATYIRDGSIVPPTPT